MDHIFPANDTMEDGFNAVADAILSLNVAPAPYPEWDAAKREFTVKSILRWLSSESDGKIYAVDQKLDAVQALTKSLANADIANPVPSTLLKPGTDPYAGVGPFRYEHVNGYKDNSGTWHITGMRSFGNFSYTDGRDVFALAPVRYVFHGIVDGKYRVACSDRPHVGYVPEDRSLRIDGTLEPFMCRAAFGASKDSAGKPCSVAGAKLWTRSCSHNSMNEAAKKKGAEYSGYTAADYDYLYEMNLLKYANKSSQANFAGCSNHTEQTPVTVAGSGAPTVTIAKTVADKWPIGSAVMVGTTKVAGRDRGNADAFDIADQANIVKKTVNGDNVILTLDCGNISTEVGQLVSTAPWNPGATVGIVGDGSPYDNKSGREPFTIQGIEVMLGAYEILGDQLVKGEDDGYGYYLAEDTSKSATSVTADYTKIFTLPIKAADGEMYPSAMVKAKGSLVPYGTGGSTGAGVGDGIWYYGGKKTDTYEVLVFGGLGVGSVAGLRRAVLRGWPGWTWWCNASRVSPNGRNRVNADVPPQAA